MAEHSFLKRRWKLLLNIATVIALIILVIAIHRQLLDTLENLGKVNAWALLLLVPIQALNYHAQTKLYQGLFAVLGNRLRYKFLFRASLELNFINHVFPSGGVSGISYFGMRLKNDEISGGKATLVQVMKLILGFLSFEVLLVIGLFCMAIGNRVNTFVIFLATAITTLMVVGTFAFVMIIGSQKRINATFRFITLAINRTLHFVFRGSRETINTSRAENAVAELHHNYKTFESHWRELRWQFFWGFMANLTEVLSIYVVYIAFGTWVNFGSVVLAYAVANFAGLVSVMPGGVGIYEALMTAVLVAAGIPARLSLPVTVMYRVLNTIIQIPPGWLLYHIALQQDNATKEMAENAELRSVESESSDAKKQGDDDHGRHA